MSSSGTTQEYNCTPCGFSTTTKSRYNQHLKTKKHARLHPENIEDTEESAGSIDATIKQLHELRELISQICLICEKNERRIKYHTSIRDIKIFTIPIHVEKDNETFDITLKAICITAVLKEDQIHKIQIIANEYMQEQRFYTFHDPYYLGLYKYNIKKLVENDEDIKERIIFVYE